MLFMKLTDSWRPVKCFLFIDEDDLVINWGNYYTDMTGYPIPPSYKANESSYNFADDLPGTYHNRAAGLSFYDGHAEIHKWFNIPKAQMCGDDKNYPVPRSKDVAWMQDHTTRPENWSGD